MADGWRSRERYGEGFWRAHHEAWQQSDLNQREYCEAHGISLKAFGNWRRRCSSFRRHAMAIGGASAGAKFKAEPQPPTRKSL
jgi:hypothetical protein